MHALFPARRRGRTNGQRGFTLIELVTVIVVLGLLASVVMLSGNPLSSSRRVNADALKSVIRLAQSHAMKSGQTWGVSWTGSTYWMFNGLDATSGNAANIPGEQTPIVNLAGRNVGLAPGAYVLAFNAAGQPFTDAALTTPLAADQTVTMTATDNSSVSTSFIITAETGYLQ